jgi:hypothetical protein
MLSSQCWYDLGLPGTKNRDSRQFLKEPRIAKPTTSQSMRIRTASATRSWVGIPYFNCNCNCNYKGPFLRRNGVVAFALDRTLRLIAVQDRPHRLLLISPATEALHRHGAPQPPHRRSHCRRMPPSAPADRRQCVHRALPAQRQLYARACEPARLATPMMNKLCKI